MPNYHKPQKTPGEVRPTRGFGHSGLPQQNCRTWISNGALHSRTHARMQIHKPCTSHDPSNRRAVHHTHAY